MEKKFYTDDFEQFLKDTTDDFRMYPSKRVWNSLYNNLHPGRKWPSLAVCLLLVSSIIFIGLAHKNEISGTGNATTIAGNTNEIKNSSASLLSASKTDKNINTVTTGTNSTISNTTIPGNTKPAAASITASTNNSIAVNTINNKVAVNRIATTSNNNLSANVIDQHEENASIADNQNNRIVTTSDKAMATAITSPAFEEDATASMGTNTSYKTALVKNTDLIAVSKEAKSIEIGIIERNKVLVSLVEIAKNNKAYEKEWIEDYAFHNQPKPTIKSRSRYQLYITPSVGYRSLKQTLSYKEVGRPSLVTTNVPDGPNPLMQDPGFNLEAGYALIYPVSKVLRLKAGVQFNFTNYRIHAHDMGHTALTNIAVHNSYDYNAVNLVQKSTHLANLEGADNNKNLNNSSLQVSLPLGADIKLAGKNKLQWFAGATIQPTYVLFGNAYLISADFKNYVYDSKFLRKWNLNGGIETFLSYTTKTGVTFNAGPQFRYQFFSSYDKRYAFNEKLYNIGLKFGITRNF